MSEYTREEILKLIEENGGPEGLDLSCANLAAVDLGWQAIEKELDRIRLKDPDASPVWYSRKTEGINFHGVDLTLADCEETNLEWADLEGAKLYDTVFDKAHLWKANLRGVILSTASFRETDLNCADLRDSETFDTDFRGAYLNGARLEGVDLFSAKSLVGIHVGGAVLGRTQMRWEQLGGKIGEEIEGDYWLAKEAYLNLKSNFTSLGRYDDAGKAYIKERRMEKMCSAPWRARRVYMGERDLGYRDESELPVWHLRILWFYARHTWKWLWDWVAELVCGYGESIGRVLANMVVVLVGFTVFYWATRSVVDQSGARVSNFLDCLIFSLGAFTTLGFRGLEPVNRTIELWTNLQALLGIGLTGLLGFVLGNRIRRL